jgi:hypothetical protein
MAVMCWHVLDARVECLVYALNGLYGLHGLYGLYGCLHELTVNALKESHRTGSDAQEVQFKLYSNSTQTSTQYHCICCPFGSHI